MLAKCFSATVIGIDARLVEVEVNAIGSGDLSQVSIVGLPDLAIRESRDRVRSALLASGFQPPQGSTVVSLAPGDLPKEGAGFDLAIALAMLAATGALPREELAGVMLLGELALDGTIRPVRGALPIAALAAELPEVRALIVPSANASEAALAAGSKVPVFGMGHLRDATDYFQGKRPEPCHAGMTEYLSGHRADLPDLADLKGQTQARRALEIAAAGGHNLLLIGPPGTGKSMIAARLPGILPPMTPEETLEVSRIHSVLGLLSDGEPLVNRRPFRAPHHTVSDIALIGGGRDPHPGEISLAHRGVLFLDELPEFRRTTLEVLRQPLETGNVTVARAAGSCTFPARFMLVAAMNPCPCGRGSVELGCHCRSDEKLRYRKKISGPLLDRIDLHVTMNNLTEDELINAAPGESSQAVLERVVAARKIAERRFAGKAIFCNAQMGSAELREFCRLSPGGELLLRRAINQFHLSPRAYDRILKVARTIADLAGAAELHETHLLEAVNYRTADRSDW